MIVSLLFALALVLLAWMLSFVGDALARRSLRPCPRRAVLRASWWLFAAACSASLWVLLTALAERW